MMKKIFIFVGITSLFLSSSILYASDQSCHTPGFKISLKIKKLQKKLEEHKDQIERIKSILKENNLENENQLYTFLLSKKEASKNKENVPNQLESDIERCRLGECYFLLSISQCQKRINDLQEINNNKYLNKKNECSLEDEIEDLRLIKRKYTASDYSDYF